MPNEYDEQLSKISRESSAAFIQSTFDDARIFGRRKKGNNSDSYPGLSAAGTVPAFYRLNRCVASPRLSMGD